MKTGIYARSEDLSNRLRGKGLGIGYLVGRFKLAGLRTAIYPKTGARAWLQRFVGLDGWQARIVALLQPAMPMAEQKKVTLLATAVKGIIDVEFEPEGSTLAVMIDSGDPVFLRGAFLSASECGECSSNCAGIVGVEGTAENLKAHGGSLIEELRNHVADDAVRANFRQSTLSLEELRELSGFEI